MNCFFHPETPAVAMCKFCQKGLCRECARDLGHGMSCRDHEREVRELNESFLLGRRTNLGAGKFYQRFALVFVFFGIVMIAGGLFMGPLGLAMVITGACCLLFAGLYYFWGRRYRNTRPDEGKEKRSSHGA